MGSPKIDMFLIGIGWVGDLAPTGRSLETKKAKALLLPADARPAAGCRRGILRDP